VSLDGKDKSQGTKKKEMEEEEEKSQRSFYGKERGQATRSL